MANLDVLKTRGKSDVEDKLKEATQDAQKIGTEYKETKDGLSGMPGGLESDIMGMIKEAKEEGKREAEKDIEGVKSSLVADAKKAVDSIKTDATQKISDNTQAKSKLESIKSKYGKARLDRAATALEQNSSQTKDLMKMLEDAQKTAEKNIEGVKGNL